MKHVHAVYFYTLTAVEETMVVHDTSMCLGVNSFLRCILLSFVIKSTVFSFLILLNGKDVNIYDCSTSQVKINEKMYALAGHGSSCL